MNDVGACPARERYERNQGSEGCCGTQHDSRLPETYQWLLVPVQASPQAAVAWQATRLQGTEPLAVRASKRLKSDELLITSLGPTRLRMDLDGVPLWSGDHVAIRQLVDYFARYLYLPRLSRPTVLLDAIVSGVGTMLWERESFAFAESYDDDVQRYRGLRGGEHITLSDASVPGLLIKPEVARRQFEKEIILPPPPGPGPGPGPTGPGPGPLPPDQPPLPPPTPPLLKRFHGSVMLDEMRVGRDAGGIAEEVIAHLSGITGAKVRVTLEIEAAIPTGAPDHVVRTVTENGRTLKFMSQGFEPE
jgi:hypothetical protein